MLTSLKSLGFSFPSSPGFTFLIPANESCISLDLTPIPALAVSAAVSSRPAPPPRAAPAAAPSCGGKPTAAAAIPPTTDPMALPLALSSAPM